MNAMIRTGCMSTISSTAAPTFTFHPFLRCPRHPVCDRKERRNQSRGTVYGDEDLAEAPCSERGNPSWQSGFELCVAGRQVAYEVRARQRR